MGTGRNSAAASSTRPRSGRGIVLPRRRGSGWIVVLGAAGATWGAASYAILWGYTSIVVTRRFVDSVAGLATMLPVRAILYSIHLVETLAGHPFDFSRNHGWIGLLAAGTGACLLVVPVLLIRIVARHLAHR